MAPVPKSNGDAEEVKRRGRPKGARNKATLLSSLALAPKSKTIGEAQRKRGRPKGAKNKSTVPAPKTVKAKKIAPNTKVGGKRGRPKTKTDTEYPVKFVNLVLAAFQALDNRKGSSLQAIKKYLKENDGIDSQKKAIYINKSVRKLTEDGTLRHRVGVGVRGTFKLASA
ncbi:histone H1-delta-like [Penaeus monodon]|uniref:histone H1-delta-like n=1 Tax=Penaeus monodon TaxID=6687 RepID=UPI0018A71ACD|nr:histone H1-delta-like [Penaeus monodon]